MTRLDVLHRPKRKDDKIFTHQGNNGRVKEGRRLSTPSWIRKRRGDYIQQLASQNWTVGNR